MVVQPGAVLGRYKVESLIGRGGMGEVYRARDTTLGREVAIKALSGPLATDPERLSRFEREAHLLASLNHPHIAVLYGLERVDGVPFLAMELVPGESLAERLSRGPIPLEEALPLFRQISEALEAAHESGMVHRDLKPANVMVTPEGKVKVLDFGLAKALDDEPREGEISESPTNTYGATGAGVVLGTASYMSPEQARGKKVDPRTDIWALGAVMYESLTGRKAFPGETVTDVLAAILKNEPDWEALRAPAPLKKLLKRCLQKDPARRLHHAADVRIEIEEAAISPEAAAGKRSLPPWIFGAVMAAVAALLLWAPWREPPSRPVVRTSLNLGDVVPAPPRSMKALALAPDGVRVVFAGSRGGRSQLFLRDLDGFDTSAIAGTEGGYGPFFSPDGMWLAFFAGGKLKKVPLDGGLVQNIADAPNPGGGVWGDGDDIVFVASRYSGLVRVRADGGSVEPVKGEIGLEHGSPSLLPDGKTVLLGVRSSSVDSEIQIVNLETGDRETLVKEADSPAYLATGHLVYNQAGTLFAVSFDATRRVVKGQAKAILSGVFVHYSIHAQYDVSREGSLVYVPSLNPRRLVSVDRNGAVRPVTAEPGAYGMPRLSPDGKSVALMIYDGMTARYTWIYDIGRESFTRLPFERGYSTMGAWAPDGRSIAFSARLPEYQLHRIQFDGNQVEPLAEPVRYSTLATSWTPDGRTLVYDVVDPPNGYDVWMLSMGSMGGEKRASPLLQSRFNERSAELSPDGRFIAYVLDESGRDEVYVQPFPGPGARWTISADGGTEPCWSRGGQELFYREGDNMMVVRIETAPEFSASKPAVLFTGRYETSFMVAGRRFYDVFPDGNHFLMIRSENFTGATQLSLVQNWVAEVERLAPAP